MLTLFIEFIFNNDDWFWISDCYCFCRYVLCLPSILLYFFLFIFSLFKGLRPKTLQILGLLARKQQYPAFRFAYGNLLNQSITLPGKGAAPVSGGSNGTKYLYSFFPGIIIDLESGHNYDHSWAQSRTGIST